MEKLIETHTQKPEVSVIENEKTLRAISFEDEMFLDSKISILDAFIANNHGLGKAENEKDELYYTAQSTWREYVDRLKSMNYTFYLNRKQYNFLTNLLISKLEYDVNTVFLAIELSNMLGNWETTKGKKDSKDDNEVKEYVSDATEITYIYHLIAKHTVKGLTHDTYLFAQILRKIGFISKIVSYYDTHAKTFNKDIQDWASTFEANVYVEGKSWGRKEAEALKLAAANLPTLPIVDVSSTPLAVTEDKPKKKKKEETKEETDQIDSAFVFNSK